MDTRNALRWLAILACIAALSCDDGASGTPCSSADDCGFSGLVCYDGRCRTPCSYAGECMPSETCRPVGGGYCLSSYVPCLTSSDCGPYDRCVSSGDGVCVGNSSAAVPVQEGAYRLTIGVASSSPVRGGACATLWACRCEGDPGGEICYALRLGYYSEAGCAAILVEAGCGSVGPPLCDDYECMMQCQGAGHLYGQCMDDACFCTDS